MARDLLDDLRRQLDEMVKPDSESVRWRHARTMNQVNARLSDVAEIVDQLNVRNR